MKRLSSSLIALGLMAIGATASAQSYPSKVIRFIVPYAPGGSTNVMARIIEPGLSLNLGQSVIVENKPGAGGMTGTIEVLRSPPDGYTIGLSSLSTVATIPAINPKTPYSPADITPIIDIAATATLIAVNPNFPAKNYKEFIAELKRNRTKHSFGSSGTGGVSHLQMERFKSLADVSIVHVPYRGAGPAITDAVGGQIGIVMDALPSILPFIKSGQLRAIVVASPTRVPSLPDTPTFTEVGLPEMNRRSNFGIIGPKGMPVDIVNKINAAVRKTLEDPAVRQRLEEAGASPVGGTPAEFASEINEDFALFKKIVAERKLSIEP
jgi:tripartite-type tricarboxylate transporter receptor subunit TctC